MGSCWCGVQHVFHMHVRERCGGGMHARPCCVNRARSHVWHALWLTTSPLCNCHAFRAQNGQPDFCGETLFREVWGAWLDHLQYDTLFECPLCGPSPEVLVCDGTALSIRSHHYHGTPITTPAEQGAELRREHDRLRRCAVQVDGAEGRRLRSQLMRLAERARGRTEARQRDASVQSPIDDSEVAQLLRSLPLTVRGGIHVIAAAAGIPCGNVGSYAGAPAGLVLSRTQARAAQLPAEHRKVLVRVLTNLATDSAVCSYISAEAARVLLQACVAGQPTLSPAEMTALEHGAPQVHGVISLFTSWGIHGCHLPIWRLFWQPLAEQALFCYTGPDAGPLLPPHEREEQPSCATSARLDSGICTGQLRVRPRYKCELDGVPEPPTDGEQLPCRHAFGKHASTTGGLFSWFCPHGICYAFYMMKGAEGRDEVYSFLVQSIERAPKVVVYDYACAAEEYCLNRAPAFFESTKILVDRFDWHNHVACSYGFCMNEYSHMDRLNSQAAEQSNSRLAQVRSVAAVMKQRTLMRNLRFYFARLNRAKAASMQASLASIMALLPPGAAV